MYYLLFCSLITVHLWKRTYVLSLNWKVNVPDARNFKNFMAEIVYTQIMSSKVGQVNGVSKVLGQKSSKVDVGVWINFSCNQLHFLFSNRVGKKSTLITQECIITKNHASFLPIQYKFIKWCLFIANWTNPSCFSTTEQDT